MRSSYRHNLNIIVCYYPKMRINKQNTKQKKITKPQQQLVKVAANLQIGSNLVLSQYIKRSKNFDTEIPDWCAKKAFFRVDAYFPSFSCNHTYKFEKDLKCDIEEGGREKRRILTYFIYTKIWFDQELSVHSHQ